ncbi:lipoprotein-releasing ABC transporter permease subunit [Litoribrevibacter euphylliae]|uniref:Lipoprotein-releasing ABC transporter permease subunit n=1 Tax=Litoribrevibacter euphylliae TaxID=1834034 RepID=A0ABV7HFS4_9GAMM
MRTNIPLLVGLRYTRARRRNHFISFISLISMIGLMLGVAVLITVLSVMNGFDQELRSRILGMVPHATITEQGGMKDWESVAAKVIEHEDVLGVAPFINAEGMLTHAGNVKGALITGIDPQYEQEVSIIGNHMEEGSLDELESSRFGIILGNLLAAQLGAVVGDKVTLVLPEASLSPAGVMPRLKRFTVVGTFKVGADLDASAAYIHIRDGAKLYRLGNAVHGVRLKLDDLFEAPYVAWRLASDLPGRYYASSWLRSHGNLFQAIQMEKKMIGLLLLMIVAVAAFNIVSTLIIMVTEKQSDIAILRTMGASPRTIMGIFVVQGFVIGLVGTVLGALLGTLLALTVSDIVSFIENLFNIKVLDPNVYFISYLPSELRMEDVGLISLAALVLSLLATLYPAYRAAKIQPAEALRYD